MRRVARVIGGRESEIGAFPWIAGLIDQFGFNFCGGALIKSKYILTAAHCVHNKREEDLIAIIGQTDLDIGYLLKRGVYRVTKVLVHPRFILSNWSHDIALLRVQPLHPSPTSPNPEPICLPGRSERSFTDLLVAGWGKTSDSSTGMKPSRLHQVNLPQVDQSFCEATWAENQVGYDQMCAGSAGRDTCIYDSGSPLMSRKGSMYTLAGVTSFGSKKCGDPHKPGVYTRITSYLDWIHSHTHPGGEC